MSNAYKLNEEVKLKVVARNYKDNEKINVKLTFLDENKKELGIKEDVSYVKDYKAIYPFIIENVAKEKGINPDNIAYVKGWMDADGDGKIDYGEEVWLEVEIRIDPNKLFLSQKGIDFLKAYESEVKKDGKHVLYNDDAGYCTIGYGHLIGKKSCSSITDIPQEFKNGLSDENAENLFKEDIKIRENKIKKIIKVPLYQQEFDAIVSLFYNSEESLRLDYTIMQCLNKKDYEGAGNGFLLWNKGTINGKKVVLKGLDSRRKAESNIFLKGIYDSTH